LVTTQTMSLQKKLDTISCLIVVRRSDFLGKR
jgi:hypothetical protein